MRRIFYFIIALLISSPLYAATEIKDEGTHQGYINIVDCVGTGISCAASGITGTLTVSGGSAAPTDADYLVGTANGSLSAEIVVGTSPGGELGGTWASPTIDDSLAVTSWNLTTPTITTSGTVTDDTWIGLGSGAGRIEFDDQTTDEVNILNANVGIGTSTPTAGLHVALNGALSVPGIKGDGTWITGGSATTTKPYDLIEPTGSTSTAWSTNGTGLGINAATGFSGNLIDAQLDGTSNFSVSSSGNTIIKGTYSSIESGATSGWRASSSSTPVLQPHNSTLTGLRLRSDGGLFFTSGTLAAGIDTTLIRVSAGILGIGATDGTAIVGALQLTRLNIGSTSTASALEVGSTSAGLNGRLYATLGAEQAPALTAGNWTVGSGWESPIVGPGLIKNADGTGTQTPSAATTIVAGTTYQVIITLSAWSVGSASYTLGGYTGINSLNSAATFTEYITANTTGKLIITPTSTSRFTISAISIIPVTTTTGSLTVDGALLVRSPSTFSGNLKIGSVLTLDNNSTLTSSGLGEVTLDSGGTSSSVYLGANGVNLVRVERSSTRTMVLDTTAILGWSSSGVSTGSSEDTRLSRVSAGVVGVGTTGAATDITGTLAAATIELGHLTDTTIARSGAGAVTVEGVQVILSGAALGTPSSGTLTNATGLPVSGITASTVTAIGVGSIELGHASDTTIARVSAGLVSIEGSNIMTVGSTDTVTGTKTMSNIVLPDQGQIKLTVPTTDLKATGPTNGDFNSGYSSSAIGDLVYLDSSATWQKCDANTLLLYNGMLGIALEVKASGAALLVALPGSFIYSTTGFPTWTIGGPIYMSETAGAMTQTAPTTTDSATRVVGWGVHADKMYFNPSPDYYTHT